MDPNTAWLTNHQLITSLGTSNLQDLQNDIIEQVFGGFENMLKLIIKNPQRISIEIHDKLYKILLTKHDESDIYNNYKSKISNLSNDTLVNIMSFCNEFDLYNLKQTCRLFAVIFHKFKAISISPKNPERLQIIQDIQSDDRVAASDGMDRMAYFLDTCPQFYKDIKSYSISIEQKMCTHMVKYGIDGVPYDWCWKILKYELKHGSTNTSKWFGVIPKLMKAYLSPEIDTYLPSDTAKVHEIMHILNNIIFGESRHYVLDMMKNDELISTLIMILRNRENHRYGRIRGVFGGEHGVILRNVFSSMRNNDQGKKSIY